MSPPTSAKAILAGITDVGNLCREEAHLPRGPDDDPLVGVVPDRIHPSNAEGQSAVRTEARAVGPAVYFMR